MTGSALLGALKGLLDVVVQPTPTTADLALAEAWVALEPTLHGDWNVVWLQATHIVLRYAAGFVLTNKSSTVALRIVEERLLPKYLAAKEKRSLEDATSNAPPSDSPICDHLIKDLMCDGAFREAASLTGQGPFKQLYIIASAPQPVASSTLLQQVEAAFSEPASFSRRLDDLRLSHFSKTFVDLAIAAPTLWFGMLQYCSVEAPSLPLGTTTQLMSVILATKGAAIITEYCRAAVKHQTSCVAASSVLPSLCRTLMSINTAHLLQQISAAEDDEVIQCLAKDQVLLPFAVEFLSFCLQHTHPTSLSTIHDVLRCWWASS